ncbi:fimbrial protein, partial [Escherichia coli]|nr:fimbrial protein [Escherichia coli]
EVKVGAAVNGLNAPIQKGQKEVRIETKTAIPVLGIRTQTTQAFQGQIGISPQISYGNAVNVAEFSKGIAPLTLEVKDANDAKIGTATTSILAAALASYKNGDSVDAKSLYASVSGKGFFGGIGENAEAVATYPIAATSGFFAEASQNYTEQGATELAEPGETTFAVNGATYSGFYASGIEQGKTIKITLDTPASADAIVWKASLPVQVTYQ